LSFFRLFGGLAQLRRSADVRRLLDLFVRPRPFFEPPQCLDKPQGSRVIVIAPHPDDETLGCGGTLYKHHKAGDRITAVFMTDGAKGDILAQGLTGQALVELREREARTAADALGISECVFLRNPDTALECSPRTIAQLGRLLASSRPDVVYVPSPLDHHRDHRRACEIVARALAEYPEDVQVYVYETWTPIPANCAVPIDLERKLNAVRAYGSQMDEREICVHGAASLARYRGITCLPGKDIAVECFLRLDRAAFINAVQSAA
jgi:LmbE family N-acetylglucosaminyl deacetylase